MIYLDVLYILSRLIQEQGGGSNDFMEELARENEALRAQMDQLREENAAIMYAVQGGFFSQKGGIVRGVIQPMKNASFLKKITILMCMYTLHEFDPIPPCAGNGSKTTHGSLSARGGGVNSSGSARGGSASSSRGSYRRKS
jgi:hypothetical protein